MLSITSTCIASELGTDSIADCRFAKSADKMLGMILRATVSTLVPTQVLAGLAQIGRKHGIGAVPVWPELKVRTESSVGNLGQQLRCRNQLDVGAYREGFAEHIAGLPAVR